MTELNSDEEQVQALKRWWDENGTSLILTLGLGIAALVGWNWWQASQKAEVEQSFGEFQVLISQLDEVEQSPQDEVKIAALDYQAQQIMENFPNSYYASFAAFLRAKQAVADEDYDAAIEELQWVREQQSDNEVGLIATLREAQAHFAKGDGEQALSLLDVADAESFAPAFEELKGDVLMSLERYQDAHLAYLGAKSAIEESAAPSPLLDTKLGYAKSFL